MNIPGERKPKIMSEEKEEQILLSADDRQKLVGAFAWLIQEDKKQNPELYLQDCSEGHSNVQSR